MEQLPALHIVPRQMMPPRPAVLEVPGAQERDAEENAEAAQATQLATRLNEEAERARQEHLLWDRYAPAELTDVYAKRSMCRKELREAIAAAAAFAERQRRRNKKRHTQLEFLYKFEPVLAQLQLQAYKKREIHLLKVSQLSTIYMYALSTICMKFVGRNAKPVFEQLKPSAPSTPAGVTCLSLQEPDTTSRVARFSLL